MPRQRNRRSHQPHHTSRILRPGPPASAPAQPDLAALLRPVLRKSPLDFLLLISRLMEATAPSSAPSAGDDVATLAGFVADFEAFSCTETTAALHLVAALSQDEDLRTRIASTLSARHQPLPAWLGHLDDACVVGDVILVTDPLGETSSYTFAVRLAGGVRFTVVVGVAHTVAGAVREAMVVLDTPDAVAATSCEVIRCASTVGGEPVVTHPDPGDARAAIEDAIAQGSRVDPPFASPTWPANRALVEWALGLLPPDGSAPVTPSRSEENLREIADTFFASTDGVNFPPRLFRSYLHLILRFVVVAGGTNPLLWTPQTVQALFDWALRVRVLDREDAVLLTDVLITWVPYTCHLRGVDAQVTERVGGRVAELADGFVDAVDESVTCQEEEEEYEGEDDPVLAAGGEDQLAALDTVPLPDEPFDWTGVPAGIRPAVAEWLALADRCADDLFDVEHRTVFRRCLARAAASDPGLFSHPESASPVRGVAGLVDAATDANRSVGRDGPVSQHHVMTWFGSHGQATDPPVSADVWSYLYPFACVLKMHSPSLLVARRRAELIELRSRW